MTTQDLGALFDTHVGREMRNAGIPGAAVVVVKDGAVLFARGYGHADLARNTPVSPSHTVFRIASLSKVVAYTAVMRLVEQGRIDLDADVNGYLDFSIPPAFGKPITMRHLMSHTAGFADTVQGRWVAPTRRVSLGAYLEQRMPRRLFAPGTVPAYSSYGTTLAAYVVERVSGEAFDAHVARHVFAPLGMRHSSFAQPLPQHLSPLLAQGYDRPGAGARPFDIAQVWPAASMSSSPMDMARFMLAHLGGGPSSTQLLMPATLAKMHSIQFRHHPAGPGIALGWFEMGEVAPRMLGHLGDVPGYNAAMYLFPEQRTGLFIVQNTGVGAAMHHALLQVFAQRYLASPGASAGPEAAIADDIADIGGSYRSSWRFDGNPLSLRSLLKQTVVRPLVPGTITLDTATGADGAPVEWHHLGAGIWQNGADPQRRLYFRRNAQGGIELSGNRNLMDIKQRSPWYQHKYLILTLLSSSLLVALLSATTWPLSAWRQRRARSPALPCAAHRTTRKRMHWAALLTLAPWILYGCIGLVVMGDLLFVASPACQGLLRAVQLLSWVALAAGLAAIHTAWTGLRASGLPWSSRIHYVGLALACSGATTVAGLGGILFWNGRY